MSKIDSKAVAAANQRFYDQIAAVYDQVDSRRAGKIDHAWLDDVLARIVATLECSTGRSRAELAMLDAGAGSGFLAERASRFFGNLTLLDVSQAMLDRIAIPGARKLKGDCSSIPLGDESIDFIGAFATLHHLFNPSEFFAEAYRVLRKGGVLYCDHDIEQTFVRRFRLPLRAYRALFDHGHGYLEKCPAASKQDYNLSEFHGDRGLDGAELTRSLAALGFKVTTVSYHWDGMGAPAALLKVLGLKNALSARGFAPILRLVAVKA